jgi:hypothetical protein
MALASKTEKPSLLVRVGVLMISELLSLTSTESPAYAAMALICFTARTLKLYRRYFYGMGEQRTRFRSTSEVVYKVPSDMSMLCYFVEGRWSGKGVQKGKREGTRATARDLITNFSHRYLSYVTPTLHEHPFRYFSLTLTCPSSTVWCMDSDEFTKTQGLFR